MKFVVCGFMADSRGDERIECRTTREAAAAVELLLRRGFLYCHIDNADALARFRTGLDEHGDALPPLDV